MVGLWRRSRLSAVLRAAQINRSNVNKLQVAWKYPTGDNNKYFFNPLVADGTHLCAGEEQLHRGAGCATGKEVWALLGEPDTKVITHPRHQLLGEQGSIGRTAAVCEQPLPARHRRSHRQNDSLLRQSTAASI